VSLLWSNIRKFAGGYDDFDYSNPTPPQEPKPGGQDESDDRPRGCGFMGAEQQKAVAHAVAHQMNTDDLGGGKKGWYCHDCSRANGYDSLGDHNVDMRPDLPEPDHHDPDWWDKHSEKYREKTPEEKSASGAVYHTTTPEGLRVGKPRDHFGCYDLHEDYLNRHLNNFSPTTERDEPRYPHDYDVEDSARKHPHVGVQYGHEHHPEGHPMHNAEALYGINKRDGGLDLWAN
jgi:hypothetical protein